MGREPVAVVAVALRTAGGLDTEDVVRALLTGRPRASGGRGGGGLLAAVRELRLPAGRTAALVVGAVEHVGVPWTEEVRSGAEGLDRARLLLTGDDADVVLVADAGTDAVVIMLRRAADARRTGEQVLALLDSGDDPVDPVDPVDLVVGPGEQEVGFDPARVLGGGGAGLCALACAAVALRRRAVPRPGGPAAPLLGGGTALVPLGNHLVRLRSGDAHAWVAEPPPAVRVYSGADRRDVLAALRAGRESDGGPARLVLAAPGDGTELRAAAERWLASGGPRPPGAAYRDRPVTGAVAFVFGNGAAAYPGMGRELFLAFPGLVEELGARCGPVRDLVGWAHGVDGRPTARALRQIWGAGALAHVHAGITRSVLGLRPSAVLGYSSGEICALVAMDVWRDLAGTIEDVRSSWLFTEGIVGEYAALRDVWGGAAGGGWASYLVGAPAARVREALADVPAAHLVAVNSPVSCVVGGAERACARVLERLGAEAVWPVDYPIAAHVPELVSVRERFQELYHRPTVHDDVRFYSCASGRAYAPSPGAVADALTALMTGAVDFAATVERAWHDGVRVFVEHGPKRQCTTWIGETLGDREHLAVALDEPGPDVRGLFQAVAELTAAGVPVRTDALRAALAGAPAPHDLGRPADPPGPVPTAALAEHHTVVARLHRGFVEREALVHRQFLRTCRRAEALLRVGAPPPTHPVRAPIPVPEPEPVTLDRRQLELHAAGRTAEALGPAFAGAYPRRLRLPAPPMLLVDRVTGIDGEPGSFGRGAIRTETDVRQDGWYLDPTGRMAPALVGEAGQGNILLMSWLGVDERNRGERRYRLLGCELTYHRAAPVVGETLRFDIAVTGFGEHDDLLLCDFESRCLVGDTPLLTVRDARAGFFTDARLADSGGPAWRPGAGAAPPGRVDPPPRRADRTRFGREEVAALAAGRPADCFGAGWAETRAHVRTPRVAGGRLLLLDEVTEVDPAGGPWGRGYLAARSRVRSDAWFFASHFADDPCMPGTLLFQGCLQAMAFYLTAAGCTVERDGWRFEPVPEHPVRLACRGQVTPGSGRVGYEVFVREFTAGPHPTVFADLVCTVDGSAAFHARDVGLRLVPDWPLEQWRAAGPAVVQAAGDSAGDATPPAVLGGLRGYRDRRPVAEVDGFRFDYPALLASAWGRPSDAYGPSHARYDDGNPVAPRCPGPPFHFVTRIAELSGPQGGMLAGTVAEAEYDVPEQAWFFEQNDRPVMPFAVLLEVLLQPCGWLAGYVDALGTGRRFRNLDGTATVLGEVGPAAGVLRTRAEVRGVSVNDDVRILSFAATCHAGDRPVLTAETVFGFFPPAAFVDQPGLPEPADPVPLDEDGGRLVASTLWPSRDLAGRVGLPGPMLLVLDRITGYWPRGGRAGLGRIRAESDVDAGAWFFRAHFFQDPVQPGSLGLEAMGQLLRFHAVESDLITDLPNPRFTSLTPGGPIVWKYRGQVVPGNSRVVVQADIIRVDGDDRHREITADAALWVDGRRIYEAVIRIGVFGS